MIPTAKEFFESNYLRNDITITDCIIEFAKIHVAEALKQASEKVDFTYEPSYPYEINSYSILNAYPLENIK